MPQLLPSEERQGLFAWMLLIVAAIIVYWIGFHWFFQAHGRLNDDIATQRDREGRFLELIAQRPALQAEIQALRQRQQSSDLFLAEDSFNLAAAGLTSRLRNIVSAVAVETGEDCGILSNTQQPSRDPERFESVTIKVRMKCEIEPLTDVFYRLESDSPLVLIDNVSIYRQRSRRARNQGLDVRFDMVAYMRTGSPEAVLAAAR